MTDYYTYALRSGGIYCEFLIRCKNPRIAQQVIEDAFQKKEMLSGAFGIEVDTQIQSFHMARKVTAGV